MFGWEDDTEYKPGRAAMGTISQILKTVLPGVALIESYSEALEDEDCWEIFDATFHAWPADASPNWWERRDQRPMYVVSIRPDSDMCQDPDVKAYMHGEGGNATTAKEKLDSSIRITVDGGAAGAPSLVDTVNRAIAAAFPTAGGRRRKTRRRKSTRKQTHRRR